MKYQIVDTPGLLDRPMKERNNIELQAIAALEHIGNIVLFVIDYTEECGTTIEDQNSLLQDVKKLLKQKEILIIETKADLMNIEEKELQEYKSLETNLNFEEYDITKIKFIRNVKTNNIMISTKENFGLDSLKYFIINKIKNSENENPLELPKGWYRSDLDN